MLLELFWAGFFFILFWLFSRLWEVLLKVWKSSPAKQVWEWQSMLSIMPRPMAAKECLRSTKLILWGRQMVFSSRFVGCHCSLLLTMEYISFCLEVLCFVHFIVLVVLSWSGWEVPWNSIRGGHHRQLLYDGMFCQLNVSIVLSVVGVVMVGYPWFFLLFHQCW